MNLDSNNLSKDKLRSFGLVTGAVGALLFGLFFPWVFDKGLPVWPWAAAGVLWVWALVAPATLRYVYVGWMTIGHGLGWVNTRIILGIMFYAVFLPVGLVFKILGKDPMSRALIKDQESYRVPHDLRDRKHVERPF